MLAPGARVGRYTVERHLGSGGSADVWLVRHRVLDTRMALKVLRTDEPATRRRLLQEGRAQAALVHPNVVPVRDVLDLPQGLALVMPWVRGPTLAQLLALYRLTPAEAAAMLGEVAGAVAAAHAAGIVHRDLKPSNVLVDLSGGRVRPRVADFGLTGDATSALGTPAYAAPEQLAGAADGPAVDLWSIGVLACELVTGRRPFAGPDLAVRAAVQSGRFDPPTACVPELDPGWDALVTGLLATDPARRTELDALSETVRRWTGATDPLAAGSPLAEAAARAWVGPEPVPAEHTPVRHNLPAARDAFVGRGAELKALAALVDEARIVTLTGTGGTGKTRLAAELARTTADRWEGGAWWAELTEARTIGGVLSAVARALSVPLGAGDPIVQLTNAIRGRGRVLLVLDNCEQALAPVATLLAHWSARCPEASLLATSREPLRVDGERVFGVDVLPLPVDDETEHVAASDAVQLLVARARQAGRDVSVTAGNAADVASLVRQLDGLPLAIELLAARWGVMSPARLLDRLSRRFDVLRSRERDADARHRTLRATLDWSWDLLQPWEASALAQLTVFEGGFTLEAAEAVLALAPGAPWAGEVLSELVDKSLVRAAAGEATRFGMLVSVQAYASERLDTDARRGAERRHAAWFARSGEPDAVEALRADPAALRTCIADLDNLVVASGRALDAGDPDRAVSAAMAAGVAFALVGPLSAGFELLERVGPHASERRRLDATIAAGHLRHVAGEDAVARTVLERALRDARRLGHQHAECDALLWLGAALDSMGESPAALEHYERSLALARELGEARREARARLTLLQYRGDSGDHDDAGRELEHLLAGPGLGVQDRGSALSALGDLRKLQGRLDDALGAYKRALELMRTVGDRRGEAFVECNIGLVFHIRGQLEAAASHIQRSAALARDIGVRRHEGLIQGNLGVVLAAQGRWDDALAQYRLALEIAEELGDVFTRPVWLGNIGNALLNLGRLQEARDTLDAALAAVEAHRHAYILGGIHVDRARVLLALGDHAAALGEAIRAEEVLREMDYPSQLGLALCVRGEVAAALGDRDAAGALLHEADDIADALGADGTSELRREIARVGGLLA